ncbi:glutamate synthase subunit beta [Falsarthrobacter nasiphocae]|uniref:Glutamate synthase (NADPH/NADH) small chain n=1 Tax=Falsarthrobacter nasiphocae TaxID=189863 RepID=A0AAE3YFF2_9MICC|nr:glutamate synthase subunit beta [Falsarthrobacter nasiphocae]MDR6891222.1 glutamate synthase (NADPH/NADH) small chain [Falsarthrobacter nasiphocae]
MGDPRGFLKHTERKTQPRRPVPVRIMDYKEVYERQDPAVLREQASRCMDCGVPFCHSGCPLGNLIPEFNDLTYRGRLDAAAERLLATNNFPELTGRLCPAPCESSCVLGINQPAVTIKQVEASLADHLMDSGGLTPRPPARSTHKRVAVVGSGPAGLAAAQQLTRAGHTVVVYERDDRIGGLLRYGIPDYKLEKHVLDARLRQMEAEGTRFRHSVEVGRDISWAQLRQAHDAVLIATGATTPRDLPIPGRQLEGVHFAMDYLVPVNRAVAGLVEAPEIDVRGKHVVVLGGGDTGADCIGTAHRQGAASVTTLAIGAQPPGERPAHQPWPLHPTLFEVASAHEEGGERTYLASTVEFEGVDGTVTGLTVAETEITASGRGPKAGSEHTIPADVVFLALGFTGPEPSGLDTQIDVTFDSRSNVARDGYYMTSTPGVFAAGDAGRGQSLIVWAIAEGRSAAAAIDQWLMDSPTQLPAPVAPSDAAIAV